MAAGNKKWKPETTQFPSSSLKAVTHPGNTCNASFNIAACGSEKTRQIWLLVASTIRRHALKRGKKRKKQKHHQQMDRGFFFWGRAVDSIWNLARIRFLVTFYLLAGRCHHERSSARSDLWHCRQPAAPRGLGQQGCCLLKHPLLLGESTSPRTGTKVCIRAVRGEEAGRGRVQAHPIFMTHTSTFLLSSTPALEDMQHIAK